MYGSIVGCGMGFFLTILFTVLLHMASALIANAQQQEDNREAIARRVARYAGSGRSR